MSTCDHLTGINVQVGNRTNGVAGQYAYDVTAVYQFTDKTQNHATRVAFVGSSFGAPVVMVCDDGTQIPVTDWQRFGEELNPAWIRKFFTSK